MSLKNNAIALISQAQSTEELEELRIKYLGRKGEINKLLQALPDLDPKQRSGYGTTVNQAKNQIEMAINEKIKQSSTVKINREFLIPRFREAQPRPDPSTP